MQCMLARYSFNFVSQFYVPGTMTHENVKTIISQNEDSNEAGPRWDWVLCCGFKETGLPFGTPSWPQNVDS